jgi:hypothetical protein
MSEAVLEILKGNSHQRRVQLRALKRRYEMVEQYGWYNYAYTCIGLRKHEDSPISVSYMISTNRKN